MVSKPLKKLSQVPIKLSELVDIEKSIWNKRTENNTKSQEIVIDISSLTASMMANFPEEQLCGGRGLKLLQRISTLLYRMEKVGATLTFFTNCIVNHDLIPPNRLEEWMKEQLQQLNRHSAMEQMFSHSNITKLRDTDDPILKFIRTRYGRNSLQDIAKNYYVHVDVISTELVTQFLQSVPRYKKSIHYTQPLARDLEIAKYVYKKKDTVFAVLSDSPDMIIFTGVDRVWMADTLVVGEDLDKCQIMVREMEKKKLLKHFGFDCPDTVKVPTPSLINRNQNLLILWATLAGNRFTNDIDDLVKWKENHKIPNDDDYERVFMNFLHQRRGTVELSSSREGSEESDESTSYPKKGRLFRVADYLRAMNDISSNEYERIATEIFEFGEKEIEAHAVKTGRKIKLCEGKNELISRYTKAIQQSVAYYGAGTLKPGDHKMTNKDKYIHNSMKSDGMIVIISKGGDTLPIKDMNVRNDEGNVTSEYEKKSSSSGVSSRSCTPDVNNVPISQMASEIYQRLANVFYNVTDEKPETFKLLYYNENNYEIHPYTAIPENAEQTFPKTLFTDLETIDSTYNKIKELKESRKATGIKIHEIETQENELSGSEKTQKKKLKKLKSKYKKLQGQVREEKEQFARQKVKVNENSLTALNYIFGLDLKQSDLQPEKPFYTRLVSLNITLKLMTEFDILNVEQSKELYILCKLMYREAVISSIRKEVPNVEFAGANKHKNKNILQILREKLERGLPDEPKDTNNKKEQEKFLKACEIYEKNKIKYDQKKAEMKNDIKEVHPYKKRTQAISFVEKRNAENPRMVPRSFIKMIFQLSNLYYVVNQILHTFGMSHLVYYCPIDSVYILKQSRYWKEFEPLN